MDEQNLKDWLLRALQDPEIVQVIRTVASRAPHHPADEPDELELMDKDKKIKNKELTRRLLQYEEEQEKLKLQLHKQLLLVSDLEGQLAESRTHNRRLQEQKELLESKLLNLEQPYHTYCSLSVATREALKGIFKGGSAIEFLICGVQYDNLISLWDYMMRELMEGRTEETTAMVSMFESLFHSHNKIYDKPWFSRQQVQPGEKFDEDLHIRSRESKVAGTISHVLLPGFINIHTGKIVKKSVITI